MPSSPYPYPSYGPEEGVYGSRAPGSYLDNYRPAPMYRGGYSGYSGGYATPGYRGSARGYTSPSRVIDVHETKNFYKPGVYTEPRPDGRSDLPPTEIVVHPPHGEQPPARVSTSVARHRPTAPTYVNDYSSKAVSIEGYGAPTYATRRTAPTYVNDYPAVSRAAPTYVQDYGMVRSAPTRYTSPTRSYGHTVPASAYGVRHGGYGYPSGSSALALDAADGVIDGKYYGSQIVQPTRHTSSALALDAADGVIDGKFYGAPITTGPTRYASPSRGALALDAADGVIDGKYYGSPIVQSRYPSAYSSAAYSRYGAGHYSDLPRSRGYNQGVY